MSSAFRWVPIDRPEEEGDWYGHIRHKVRRDWVNGVEEPDAGYDEWERLEPTFAPGDRVVLQEGMGNYSLGVYLGMAPLAMAKVRFDGYIEPDGTRREPYAIAVNFQALEFANPELDARDEQTMTPGFRRIKAEL